MKSTPMIVAVLLSLGACKKEDAKPAAEAEAPAKVEEPPQELPEAKEEAPAPMTAKAEVKTADGTSVGTAVFEPAEGGVRIKFEGTGLPPGPHGIHVHEVGQCDAPEFKSAGGHFAPRGKQHGLENPEGHHAGDMPNLEVAEDGSGKIEYVLEGATLEPEGDNSLLKEGGTALVIHAGKDDQKTDPAGDSGARLACGVIQAQEVGLR